MTTQGILAAAVLATALSGPAAAIDSTSGTGGAPFMKMGFGSARATSLGRAYSAIAEGTESLSWNPAGLALTQQREASYSYLRYVQGVDAPLYLAYAHPLGRTVFGANLAYMSLEGFDVRDSNGVPLDDTGVQVRNGFGAFSMARSFWYETLFLG